MTDTLMTILGITLAVLVMFILPTIAIAGQYDEIAQATVEVAVAEFVNTIAEKGKITYTDYNTLIQKINSTGNSFDVQIELQIMDDNPERKTVTLSQELKEKGENLQYSIYTEDITNKIREKLNNNEDGEYNLKKDDYVIVTVKNTNITIGTEFKNFFYRIVGKDTYVIGASSSALVTNSGAEVQEEVHSNIVKEKFQEKNIKMKIHVHQEVTKVQEGVTMVVILDSESSCTPYHSGRTDTRMFTAMNSIYSSLNSLCSSFYLGFIETANPTRVIAEATKNSPPNTSQVTGTVYKGNYRTAMSKAIQTIEQKGAGTNRLNILIFMSWTGVSNEEVNAANDVLRTKKNSIDVLYTMGCCGEGSTFKNRINGVWNVTLGNKYGGHLPNGIVNSAVENMLVKTEVIDREEEREVVSTDGRILLENLNTAEDIILIVNNIEYSYKDSPFNGNVLTIIGGKYYLDLKKIAAAIGKDNLNDIDLEIKYSATG